MPMDLTSKTILIALESPPQNRLWAAGIFLSPVTNALWEARFDPPKDAPPQSLLLTKTPSQSKTSILYNFSSDYVLREQYRDAWNHIRIGKLLQDLDALASTISIKHCSDHEGSTTRPLLLVTAAVDKIMLKKPISVYLDLKIVGSVVWVGRSSIEIQLELTLPSQEGFDDLDSSFALLTANFIFVAVDCKTGKAAPVNKLLPETEKEVIIFKQADARNRLRKNKKLIRSRGIINNHRDHQLEFNNINKETLMINKRIEALLGDGWIFTNMPALADRDSILFRDTRLESSLICQPQHRNMHGRIFGGFLMHRAFELAFSTAYTFAGLVPHFLKVDHVDFVRPVDVGDFVRFKSGVMYTKVENPDKPSINVEVVAHVTRPELRSAEVSNRFYFTFTVRPTEAKAMKNKFRLRKVIPATEEEARLMLERMDADSSY